MNNQSKIRALIVDDEAHARENLKFLLNEYSPEIEIVGTAGGVAEGIEIYRDKHPELIFLDIRMPSGTEGFDFLELLKDEVFYVVFVTAFKDYAIRAFENRALHYILKPIDEEDLKETVARILERKQMDQSNPPSLEDYKSSLLELKDEIVNQSAASRIKVHHSKGVKIINPQDLSHLEGSGNCCLLHFNNGENYLDTRTLKVYEALLPKYFFRCHKSYLVNLNEVVEILHGEDRGIILKNGKRLSVARDRKKELLDRINEL